MNDDTVIGEIMLALGEHLRIRLSDLDKEYQDRLTHYLPVRYEEREQQHKALIAELEAQNAKAEAALRDAESFLDEVNGLESGEDSRPLRDRIEAEMNAHGAAWGLERERLAKAEAALKATEAYFQTHTLDNASGAGIHLQEMLAQAREARK